MKTLIPLVLFFLLLIIGCSSDPCETLSCVNGNCIDGQCQCDEGFVGPLCDELPCVNGNSINGSCDCDEGNYGALCDILSIEGTYWITQFYMNSCPLYVTEYDLSGPVEDHRVCGPNENNAIVCFANTISIDQEEKTYFWVRSIMSQKEDGTFSAPSFFRFHKGSIAAINDRLITTSDDGETNELQIEKGTLTWSRSVSDGGDNCTWTDVYSLLPQ